MPAGQSAVNRRGRAHRVRCGAHHRGMATTTSKGTAGRKPRRATTNNAPTNGAPLAKVAAAANAAMVPTGGSKPRSGGVPAQRVPAYLLAIAPGTPTYAALRAASVPALRAAAKGSGPVPAAVRAAKGSYTLAISRARAGSPGNWPWAAGLVATYLAAHCKGQRHTGPAA